MNGGFTTYRNGRGFAAKCGCGWRGPWRGLSLSVVETDAEKHAAKCPNACTNVARNGTLTRTNSGPGAVRPARDLADTSTKEGADMAHVTPLDALLRERGRR